MAGETICWHLSEEYHAPHVEGGHVRIYTEPEVRRKLRGAGLEPGHSHHAHALHAPYWWIRCAVGPDQADHPLVQAYHRLLLWDLVESPWVTRMAEKVLQPVIGKSLVVYADKAADRRVGPDPSALSPDLVVSREPTDAAA